MQTRVCRLYGQDDLRIETENAPASAHDEVLIRVGAGGVCGSDMHYYFEGGIGQIRVREPIILGHEAAGTIVALGSDVTGFAIGQRSRSIQVTHAALAAIARKTCSSIG